MISCKHPPLLNFKFFFICLISFVNFFLAQETFGKEGVKRQQRIGLYSGSFDPLHFGHLGIALEAVELLSLDKLYLMPNDVNPKKPNLSGLQVRYEMMAGALSSIGDSRIIPIKQVEYSLNKGIPENAHSRLYRFVKENHPGAAYFSIIGGDSINTVISQGFPKPSENHVVVLFERTGYPLPEIKTVKKFLRSGVLKTFSLDLPEISSTSVRKFVKLGEFERLDEYIPKPVKTVILKRGLYGAFDSPGWPNALLEAKCNIDFSIEERDDTLIKPFDVSELKEIKCVTRWNSGGLDPEVLPILASTPHSLGNVEQYVHQHFTPLSVALLSRKELPVSIYYGPAPSLKEALAGIKISDGISIGRNLGHVTANTYLVRRLNGNLELVIGSVYGDSRFLHTQALVAKAMAIAGRSANDLQVFRYSNPGQVKQEIRSIYRKALSKIPSGTMSAAVIGFRGVFNNGLGVRYLTWKRNQSQWSVLDHRLSDILFKKNPKLEIDWPGMSFEDPDLPHSVFWYRDSFGKPKSFLVTRNVYGDQFRVLLEILAEEKKIPRIIAFGNAGGVDESLKVGDLVQPTEVQNENDHLVLRNHWKKKPPFWVGTQIRPARVFSVFSPLVETWEFVQNLRHKGNEVVDVELKYTPNTLKNLTSKGSIVNFSSVLIISDIPGSHSTLEDLKAVEPILLKSKKDACDRILWELDVFSPLEIFPTVR